ncbi:hypothetical protein [Labilithrix luteola]|nr:hypothetical protein [Labilithrix luteola]
MIEFVMLAKSIGALARSISMPRHLPWTAAALLAATTFVRPAHAERTSISTSVEGPDLLVVVHDLTDYCSTNARTDVLRQGDVIRIVRDRPTRVSRCVITRDVTFVVHDIVPGTYMVSYEQLPFVAPARPLRLASTTAFVHDTRAE